MPSPSSSITDPQAANTADVPDPNKLNGTADDDNSYDKAEAARLGNYSAPSVTTGSNQDPTINAAGSGSTQAGSSNVTNASGKNTGVGASPKPGVRTYNPLGNFSSYTYQLSLYMITPDAYNAFVLSGRKNINALVNSGSGGKGGAFLIAQSGGINNQTTKRAPGFDLDYYIDDLKMVSQVAGAATTTESNVVEFSFNIYEPYGFSFLTKLKRAQEALSKLSSLPNTKNQTNPTKHIFILGIRFQGYDKDGNIADSSQYFSQDTLNTSSDRSGVYERFYDIIIETLKFKVNGTATTYAVTARPITVAVGLSVARGMVDMQAPLTAKDVQEALIGSGPGVTSLFGTLNNYQKELKDKGDIEIPLVYDIKFIGGAENTIATATLVSDADVSKRKLPMSKATNSSQIHAGTETKAITDNSKRLITITNGTPISQAIKKIIQQSDYLESTLKIIQDSELEPPAPNEGTGEIVQKDPPSFNWFNLSVQLECLGFDNKVGDWAYKITYIIQPYRAPFIITPYAKPLNYYGPHKKYEYWYTGENREIISYEQTINNGYFNVAMNPAGDPVSHAGSTATIPGKRTTGDRQGRSGEGLETHNSVLTSLFDPGSWALAKITILGDPDYLIREGADSANAPYNQFYGVDGYTINPNGGQVFIEITFREGVDYDVNDGTLDINGQVYMWSYPPNITNPPKGVVYQLVKIDHYFKGGKFTQTLDGKIAPFVGKSDPAKDAGREPAGNSNTNAADVRTPNTADSSSQLGPTSAATSGLRPDDNQSAAEVARLTAQNSVAEDSLTNQSAAETTRLGRSGTETSQVTNTNNPSTPVTADDDSVSNAGATQSGSAVDDGAGRELPTDTLNQRLPPGF